MPLLMTLPDAVGIPPETQLYRDLRDLAVLTDVAALAASRGQTTPADRRPPLPHELRAGIAGAGRARAGLDVITTQTKTRLRADRTAFLALVADYARGVLAAHPAAAGSDARALLLALGGARIPLTALPGLPGLLDASRAFHLAALQDAARLGALHVRAEARHQLAGTRPLPTASSPVAMADPPPAGYRPTVAGAVPAAARIAGELEARADYAAEAPHVDLAGDLRDLSLGMSAAGGYGETLDAILTAGAALSTAGLDTDMADALAQQGWGLGRSGGADDLAAAGLGEPVQTYASEIDDKNTCGPCFDIDGTVFPTRAEGERAYAGGVYEGCRGGGRCRGTLVYVWGAESPATMP